MQAIANSGRGRRGGRVIDVIEHETFTTEMSGNATRVYQVADVRGVLFAADMGGNAYAFDAANGAVLWRRRLHACSVTAGLEEVAHQSPTTQSWMFSKVRYRTDSEGDGVPIYQVGADFVAGMIAKAITPGTGPSGFWLTAILGIAGALAATFIGQLVGFYPEGHPAGFIASILGAVILLVAYHLIVRRSQ